MDEQEYEKKYVLLRVLKSVRDYLKTDNNSSNAVYLIGVPDDLLYQVLKLHGAEKADKLIHHIFEVGLTLWSEVLYREVFGSKKSLEKFIELVKQRNRE
jgi:hypothetical protein